MPASSSALSITVTSYATTPDVDLATPTTSGTTILFQPTDVEMYLTSASVVAFSYDGVNDHGRLDSANLKATQRRQAFRKMWFRVVSGTNPATLVTSHWSR